MLKKSAFTVLLALVLGAAFAYGVARLFILRFEAGDVYPPYSSLRADPLGTKALAEALDELPGVELRRNFRPLPQLRPGAPVTLVYTGVSHRACWTEPELAAFDALIVSGSRAVFGFFPIDEKPGDADEKRDAKRERTRKKEQLEKEKKPPGKKEDAKKRPGDEHDEATRDDRMLDFPTVAKRWGFGFGYLPEEQKAYDRHAALVEPGGHLESDLSWHSALHFQDLKPHWKVLYVCGTQPVVIERSYGRGSIVLVADSFLLSNEALRGERHARLLARLFSGPPLVIFDEESRGLRDDPGIAALALKYRLHGVIAGLALLAVLFVWKNFVRFIPLHPPQFSESDVIVGKEASEGFINLLRRSIRPANILETCVVEWRRAFAHQPRQLAQAAEIWAREQSRPARERSPLGTYRSIAQALARKR